MSRPPLLRVSFFLELPFDARLPDPATITFYDQEEALPGWQDTRIVMPWAAEPQPVAPYMGFAFRRAVRRVPIPGWAVEQVWGRDLAAIARESLLRRLRLRLRPWRRNKVGQTTVQATRLTEAPPDEITDDWLTEVFEALIEKLNQYLVGVATVARDASVGPVHRMTLQPMAPVAITRFSDAYPGGEPTELHLWGLNWEVPAAAEPLSDDQLDHAMRICAAEHAGEQPWFPYADVFLSANQSLKSGRMALAVLDAGTAAELLVNTALREAGPCLGWSPQKLTGILNAPFRDRAGHHLPRLLGIPPDLTDRTRPLGRWWSVGYTLRNEVVHQGYRPSWSEAERALTATSALAIEVGEALALISPTRELGLKLVSDPLLGSRRQVEDAAR